MDDYLITPGLLRAWSEALAATSSLDDARRRAVSLPAVGDGRRLPAARCHVVWDELEDALGTEELALAMIGSIDRSWLHPPIVAASCSPNVRTAIVRVAAHKRVVAPFRMDVAHGAHGSATTTLRWTSDAPPAGLLLTELLLLLATLRVATGRELRPVDLTAPSVPPVRDRLERWAGTRLRHDAEATVTFSARTLDLPVPGHDDGAWSAVRAALQRAESTRTGSAATSDRVRAALVGSLPAGRTALQEVATDLHMSARSLQRALREEGTSFRELRDDARNRLARHFLTETQLPYDEVAYLVGFDDVSSLHRGVRRWAGCTPRQFRAAAVGADGGGGARRSPT